MFRNQMGALSMISVTVFMLAGSAAEGQFKKGTTPPADQTVILLRQAHALLVEANHDYHGHRSKAAHEVSAAMKELGHHHHPTQKSALKTTSPGKAKSLKTGTAVHENQAISDSQMHQAQKLLQLALAQMKGGHPVAYANTQAAIVEIDRGFQARASQLNKK